jgi:curved DNA-binding protein
MKNYYDILGVSEDASSEQIKKAFKDIAKKEHPDRGGNEAIFKEANEAHDTLKDAKKRQEYDTVRKFGEPGTGGNFSFRSGDIFGEDMFEQFFSGFGGPEIRTRTFRQRSRGNKSVNVRMAVSLKEVMNNIEKTISYKLPSGKEEFATVKIPAGVQHGVTFKYKGMGDNSIANVPRGDLMVQMTVLDCDGYTRNGNDLHTTKTINCFEAIRGCEIELRELNDNILKVKVPAGTQPNTVLSVKGKGMPVHKTLNIRGNLLVRVMVLIPQLSAADLKKIKDL